MYKLVSSRSNIFANSICSNFSHNYGKLITYVQINVAIQSTHGYGRDGGGGMIKNCVTIVSCELDRLSMCTFSIWIVSLYIQ